MRILAISLLFLTASCGQKKFDDDIKMLDSLQKKVVEVKENFSSLDSAKFNDISNEIPMKMAELKKVYQPDSINIPISTLINNFNGYRNYKGGFNMQRLRIKKEIPYTVQQIGHLVTDLKNNSLPSNDASKYIGIERKAAVELIGSFTKLKTQSAQKVASYDSLRLLMDGLIDSLRNDSLNVQAIRLKLLKARTKKR